SRKRHTIYKRYVSTDVCSSDLVIEIGNLDQLRHLSWIKIEVTTATPMTALAKQAGVHDLTYRDSEHTKAVFTADRDALGTIMTTDRKSVVEGQRRDSRRTTTAA